MSMLQYFDGATPKRKRQKTAEETKTDKKKYETTRQRKFLPSWSIDRPWLHFDANSTYGDKEVEVLFQQFSPVIFVGEDVSVEEVLDEWSTLRTLVYKKYPDLKGTLLWEHVIRDLADHLENIFRLIEVLLALPPTSVKCEQAFSSMKLLKSKRRGRLGNSRLNDLMSIKIMSPSIEDFDPEPAIADWMMSTPSGQNRRVGERVKKSAKAKEGTSASDTMVVDSDTDEDVVEGIIQRSTSQGQMSLKSSLLDDFDGDGDSDSDGELEMSQDLVFSLLTSYDRD